MYNFDEDDVPDYVKRHMSFFNQEVKEKGLRLVKCECGSGTVRQDYPHSDWCPLHPSGGKEPSVKKERMF